MPELPEVEVTRRSFAAPIAGACILGAALGRPLRWPLGLEARQLAGQHILGVRRRGKYLLVDLDAGILLLHLGMSGSLCFAPDPALLGAPGPHDHFDLVTTRGTLRLHDPRRFGAVVYLTGEDDPRAQKLLGHLGVEPLGSDFVASTFHAALQRSRSSIKALLLAGRVVVGVGNIYACEALFAAGIHPATPACTLGPRRAARLHVAIRTVLEQAVALGGSTLRDFQAADGQHGHFQLQARVYGRAGERCTRCATPIRLLRQGQRSSFFCPRCQRA